MLKRALWIAGSVAYVVFVAGLLALTWHNTPQYHTPVAGSIALTGLILLGAVGFAAFAAYIADAFDD